MPDIQGMSPEAAWTTLYGIIAMGLIFIVFYNVYNAIHTIVERRRLRKEAEKPDLADKISVKVIEKLEPRFKEIESKLDNDKNRLDKHDLMIQQIQQGQRDTREGLVAICKTLVVMANYGDLGNSNEVREASAELNKYLAGRL